MTGPTTNAGALAIIVSNVGSMIAVTVALVVDLPVPGVLPQPDPR